MNETKVKQIAMNLTATEFQGFCKGMELTWFFRGIPEATKRTVKYKNFWDNAYLKYVSFTKEEGDL